ncbi:MAG: copper resistance protein CopC, partial [Micrococcales bacterium]|nr:copper resistance protein CopC [Micrococcales bacterium]
MNGTRGVGGSRWLVRAVLATLLVVLAGVGAVEAADAHTGFEGSTPAAGATVRALPTPVRLRFADPVLPGTAAGVLTGPDGRVTLDTPTIRGVVVTLTLPRVRHAGRYVLAWRVVAEDGHPVAGTLPLVVAPAAVRAA